MTSVETCTSRLAAAPHLTCRLRRWIEELSPRMTTEARPGPVTMHEEPETAKPFFTKFINTRLRPMLRTEFSRADRRVPGSRTHRSWWLTGGCKRSSCLTAKPIYVLGNRPAPREERRSDERDIRER
jgi:hypothetical protein